MSEKQLSNKVLLLLKTRPSSLYKELTWTRGLHNGAFKDFDIPEKYCFWGNADSGFIYDDRYNDCQRLDLDTSVRRTYDQLAKESSGPIVFDLPRLCLCKIKGKDSPEFELLCACWHGPNNIGSDEKKSHLRSLLRFLLKIKLEWGNLPLMIGGDFNLDSSKVDDVCGEISNNINLKTRSQSESILMWVITDDFDNAFSLFNGYEKKIPAFDHNVMTMEVLTVADTEREIKIDGREERDFSVQVIKAKSTGRFEYRLKIKRTKENPNVQRLIVAHWEGTDAEYSDDAKTESLFSTINFLRDQLQNKGVICDFDLPWLRKDVTVTGIDNAWIVSEKGSPQNEEPFSIDLPFPLGKFGRSANQIDMSLRI